MLTTKRKALIIPWVNQERQIQGISLIKHIWVCNILLYHLERCSCCQIKKIKDWFVLPPKGTVPLPLASLVKCSHSLPHVSSGKRGHTQWLLRSLIQQKTTNSPREEAEGKVLPSVLTSMERTLCLWLGRQRPKPNVKLQTGSDWPPFC